jgi:hypothetical protein
MYCSPNYKSKKELKEAVAAGKTVTVFQPNGDMFGVTPPTNGKVALEGPHYPQPHKWYATATIQDGKIVKVS